MFREPLKENVADEIADVASRSLGKQILGGINIFTAISRWHSPWCTITNLAQYKKN